MTASGPPSTPNHFDTPATADASAVASGNAQTFGRYQLLELIGRGGMAEVFKAKSFGVEGFEKALVIKRIVPQLAVHEEFVEMFVQEAKLAVQLSHANIVQVFDLGRIENSSDSTASYYIAMEWVPGLDLASVMAHRYDAVCCPGGRQGAGPRTSSPR